MDKEIKGAGVVYSLATLANKPEGRTVDGISHIKLKKDTA